jgi:hypothetical protein
MPGSLVGASESLLGLRLRQRGQRSELEGDWGLVEGFWGLLWKTDGNLRRGTLDERGSCGMSVAAYSLAVAVTGAGCCTTSTRSVDAVRERYQRAAVLDIPSVRKVLKVLKVLNLIVRRSDGGVGLSADQRLRHASCGQSTYRVGGAPYLEWRDKVSIAARDRWPG